MNIYILCVLYSILLIIVFLSTGADVEDGTAGATIPGAFWGPSFTGSTI